MDMGNIYMNCTKFLLQKGHILQPELQNARSVPISAAGAAGCAIAAHAGAGPGAVLTDCKTSCLRYECTDVYNGPSDVMCVNISSSTNCAEFSFCLSVGRTRLFCTMAMLEPQMTGQLKMETCGK